MGTKRVVESGLKPHVRIDRVRGDLRVEGHEEPNIQMVGGPESTLEVEQVDGMVVLRSRASLKLRVPRQATLEVGQIGGELSVDGVGGDVHIGKVGGDARLKNGGGVVVDRVGGDAIAGALSGRLSLKAIGGDVLVDEVAGEVEVLGAGGDITLRGMGAGVEVAVGGDASVNLRAGVDGSIDVSAGGDVFCRVPRSASLKVRVSAGGDIKVTGDVEPRVEWGETSFELGDAQHALILAAGGDAWLAVGEGAEAPVEMEDLGAAIAAKVGQKLAEVESTLTSMGAEFESMPTDRITSRVQRVVDRAIRRHGHVEIEGSMRQALDELSGSATSAPVTDEERMKVLSLLEEKKITVEQAEALLEALEG
jgi:hypothetical protein